MINIVLFINTALITKYLIVVKYYPKPHNSISIINKIQVLSLDLLPLGLGYFISCGFSLKLLQVH